MKISGKLSRWLIYFIISLLLFFPGCGSTPTPEANDPIILSFSAEPSSILSGESSTLSWQVSDATGISIDQGIGTVALSGSTSVSPTVTTTYTLTATNTARSVTAQTIVTVSAALTVTYDGNGATGGKVPVDISSPYEYGETVTVLGNTGDLTRINDGGTSYHFTGWNTKADGSGADLAEGSTFIMGTSPVILYAQWTPYVLRDIGPAGGYIFYDKGYYSKADFSILKAVKDTVKIILPPITPIYIGWRYLEAAPVSTEWTDIRWGSYGTLIGGTETGIGTGQSNTSAIVIWLNSNGVAGRAAQRCNDLIVDDYSDWFLPSKDELNLMYKYLKAAGVGGFADDLYWSSSEGAANYAWYQNFSNGYQTIHFKNNYYRVRAARAF